MFLACEVWFIADISSVSPSSEQAVYTSGIVSLVKLCAVAHSESQLGRKDICTRF